MISRYIQQSLTFGCFLVGILTMLYYDIYDLILYGISWVGIWTVWCYYACLAIYWPPGYFFIVCYYLKLRLTSFKIRLKTFSQRINRLSNNTKSVLVKRFLKEHKELCQQTFTYNKFWRKYLKIEGKILEVRIWRVWWWCWRRSSGVSKCSARCPDSNDVRHKEVWSWKPFHPPLLGFTQTLVFCDLVSRLSSLLALKKFEKQVSSCETRSF